MDLLCFKNDNYMPANALSHITCRTTNYWTFLGTQIKSPSRDKSMTFEAVNPACVKVSSRPQVAPIRSRILTIAFKWVAISLFVSESEMVHFCREKLNDQPVAEAQSDIRQVLNMSIDLGVIAYIYAFWFLKKRLVTTSLIDVGFFSDFDGCWFSSSRAVLKKTFSIWTATIHWKKIEILSWNLALMIKRARLSQRIYWLLRKLHWRKSGRLITQVMFHSLDLWFF